MDSGDNREIEKNDESRNPTSSSGPLTSSKEDFFAALAAQNQDLINQMLSSCLSNPVPNKTSSFDKWKKKVLKNQENNPEYGPKEIATFPSQCLAITRSIGCQNFVHFGIKNNSNTPIKYSVNLTNQFLEIVGNSEGVVDIGCTVRVPILCKFDSHAPVDDELILKFGESEKIFTRKKSAMDNCGKGNKRLSKQVSSRRQKIRKNRITEAVLGTKIRLFEDADIKTLSVFLLLQLFFFNPPSDQRQKIQEQVDSVSDNSKSDIDDEPVPKIQKFVLSDDSEDDEQDSDDDKTPPLNQSQKIQNRVDMDSSSSESDSDDEPIPKIQLFVISDDSEDDNAQRKQSLNKNRLRMAWGESDSEDDHAPLPNIPKFAISDDSDDDEQDSDDDSSSESDSDDVPIPKIPLFVISDDSEDENPQQKLRRNKNRRRINWQESDSEDEHAPLPEIRKFVILDDSDNDEQDSDDDEDAVFHSDNLRTATQPNRDLMRIDLGDSDSKDEQNSTVDFQGLNAATTNESFLKIDWDDSDLEDKFDIFMFRTTCSAANCD
ncbi:Protein CBG27515 [Caenorhabditis briggsae]|uniref:Protein CBG27515 n=1 Tax=Caenorhabditis briggsae TaxID=6238 RepID=B6IF30_CAEBR|nr:Protein CBG27515 [Caenorhabditis briggsae]CAR98510.1 Protein CBG27515 [Caenorhabditis briggsae]